MMRKNSRAAIKAIRSYLPTEKLTNEQLAEEFGDVEANVIFERTGIRVRSIAASGECASDLGVMAANRLFESGACAPAEIDFLILCTQSPDYFAPTTACTMQSRLGLATHCGAIDVNQGCSGYVYSLALAKSLVETGMAENVLLVTADTYTKFINKRDRTNRTLFGDGATATLVRGVDSEEELTGPFVFGTDGRGAQQIIVTAGGFRQPLDAEALVEKEDESGNWRSASNLYMNGGEVFSFTLQTVPRALGQLLEKSHLTLDEIDYFIPHQANKFMLERLRARMKIPKDKFLIDLEESANTVSSTIPLALENAIRRGHIKSGDTLILAGFGIGYSWAAAVARII